MLIECEVRTAKCEVLAEGVNGLKYCDILTAYFISFLVEIREQATSLSKIIINKSK